MRVGAPLGGRVHWLLHNLPVDFKRAYVLDYDYSNTKQYTFYRLVGHKLYDVFLIERTSKRCFRCMYHCVDSHAVEYFTARRSRILALRMYIIYKKTCDRGKE